MTQTSYCAVCQNRTDSVPAIAGANHLLHMPLTGRGVIYRGGKYIRQWKQSRNYTGKFQLAPVPWELPTM